MDIGLIHALGNLINTILQPLLWIWGRAIAHWQGFLLYGSWNFSPPSVAKMLWGPCNICLHPCSLVAPNPPHKNKWGKKIIRRLLYWPFFLWMALVGSVRGRNPGKRILAKYSLSLLFFFKKIIRYKV